MAGRWRHQGCPEATRQVVTGHTSDNRSPRKFAYSIHKFIEIYSLTLLVCFLTATSVYCLPIDISIIAGHDDGEEVDNRFWKASRSRICMGRDAVAEIHDLGLRFCVPHLAATDRVLFARLRFSGNGGQLGDELNLTVTGALEEHSPLLSQQRRPSQLPRTNSMVEISITEAWLNATTTQNFYYTEDISEIINEIISQTGWGHMSPALVLMVDDSSPSGSDPNFVLCTGQESGGWSVTLQICRTLDETFVCHEILGRPTDRSVTINFTSLVSLQVYVEYGEEGISYATRPRVVPAGEACKIDLTGLRGDAAYTYRLRYRLAGTVDPYTEGSLNSFHTQRSPGESFTFTIQADSHIWDSWATDVPENDAVDIYRRTLQNVALDEPDFHFSLGDFSMTEYSRNYVNAWDRYAVQRRYLDEVLHSIPFYLVIGNHEGELGYLLAEEDSVAVWAERARHQLVANPYPNHFYAGCPEPPATGAGFRESYFAWEWGDALFVVLDPYWYTTSRPFHNPNPEDGGGWAWTLGLDQYEWLYQTLSNSAQNWKIVLLHHLTGGIINGPAAYGRGGTEVVKWAVANNPTFEWGGEDEEGEYVFEFQRPGWLYGSIHDMLVATGVQMVIHGHDHLFAVQEWEGISYVECPVPTDRHYTYGYMASGEYADGVLLPNSGHVRFRVSPDEITMDYIRSYLPGEGPNGEVAYSQTLTRQATKRDTGPVPSRPELRIYPNPTRGSATVSLTDAFTKAEIEMIDLSIYDISGRLRASLVPLQKGAIIWNRHDSEGRPVPAGVYYIRATYLGGECTRPLLVIR